MLSESEYNQDHRTWQDSSSVRSILFVILNIDQAIYEDYGKCVSLCSPESFDFKYPSKGYGKEE